MAVSNMGNRDMPYTASEVESVLLGDVKCCTVKAFRPRAGQYFIFPNDNHYLEDGYKWSNVGVNRLPQQNPICVVKRFKIWTSEGGNMRFQKLIYVLLENDEKMLVYYVGNHLIATALEDDYEESVMEEEEEVDCNNKDSLTVNRDDNKLQLHDAVNNDDNNDDDISGPKTTEQHGMSGVASSKDDDTSFLDEIKLEDDEDLQDNTEKSSPVTINPNCSTHFSAYYKSPRLLTKNNKGANYPAAIAVIKNNKEQQLGPRQRKSSTRGCMKELLRGLNTLLQEDAGYLSKEQLTNMSNDEIQKECTQLKKKVDKLEDRSVASLVWLDEGVKTLTFDVEEMQEAVKEGWNLLKESAQRLETMQRHIKLAQEKLEKQESENVEFGKLKIACSLLTDVQLQLLQSQVCLQETMSQENSAATNTSHTVTPGVYGSQLLKFLNDLFLHKEFYDKLSSELRLPSKDVLPIIYQDTLKSDFLETVGNLDDEMQSSLHVYVKQVIPADVIEIINASSTLEKTLVTAYKVKDNSFCLLK